MNTFFQPAFSPSFQLTPDEAHHAIKVLRHQAGDVIQLTDGAGNRATARIHRITKTECFCELLTTTSQPRRPYFIHLAIAPTKNSDRMEWLVEKCVEIGVDQITFIYCQHSERKKINMDRLEKVAISAMKQSQQVRLPKLSDTSFQQIMTSSESQRFIAHVDATNPFHLSQQATEGGTYLILIGPEGDFSEDELRTAQANGFRKVNLGPNRLRTETAGLLAVTALNLINSPSA